MKMLIGLLFVGLAVSACNKEEKDESIKYSYTCGACATGDQSFSSQGDYCAGLLDESRNNSCCRHDREQAYAQQCK